MEKYIEWQLWSVEQIAKALPDLTAKFEAHFEEFPEEYRDKNQAVIDSLKANPPTAVQVRDGSRNWDLVALGFALDALGRRASQNGDVEDSLKLFQAAHELFRSGNPALRPTKSMRMVLVDALRVMLTRQIALIKEGETDAGQVLDGLNSFVTSAWGQIPPQLSLSINEMLLTDLERVRVTGEDDSTFHDRFVRNNIETVLGIEIPTRLERIRERWEDIAEHVAPTAVRMAQRKSKRAENLSDLLPHDVWDGIRTSVEQGNAEKLYESLAKIEDELETNLRLRLDVKPDYRQPVSEVRYMNNADRFFVEARALLLRNDSRALKEFNNIHFRRSNNPFAKEWYAYALSKFGEKWELIEIIDLLEDASTSPEFREDLGWTARWNLACALSQIPDRAHEALDKLLPVLNNDAHLAEVFELCLLWALEQNREDLLPSLFLKSPYYEAHLLSALQESEDAVKTGDRSRLWDHFRRVSRILRDPDHVFPDPKERLGFDELDQLTRDFIETSLIVAGVEWFRQHVSYGNEATFFKNWECAAMLNEEAGDFKAAWRCRLRQWESTRRNPRVNPSRKTGLLRFLLNWALKNKFEEDGLRILNRSWRSTDMSESDVRLWEERLKRTPSDSSVAKHPKSSFVPPKAAGITDAPNSISGRASTQQEPSQPQITTLAQADKVVQQVAGTFGSVRNAEALSDKSYDAERLLVATAFKYSDTPPEAFETIREIVHFAVTFHKGVDEQQEQTIAKDMKDRLAPLRNQRPGLPFELIALAQACERVIQNMAVRAKAIPQISITTPDGLKFAFDQPTAEETYSTHIFVRLQNPSESSEEEMRDLKIAFMTTSAHVHFSEEPVTIDVLPPKERQIVECPVEVSDQVENPVEVRVHVTYTAGGVPRTAQAKGLVTVRQVGAQIPETQRYITSGPVKVDRSDLFHGRDKELADLLAAFAGGRLLRLHFVNGIRAVGKSTLMVHLSARCGPEVLPIIINLQDVLAAQKMNAIQVVRGLIREAIKEVQRLPGLPGLSLAVPGLDVFELDPPWVVFDNFLEELKLQTQRRSVLLAFDEMQQMIKRIAAPDDPMDDAFLSWLRNKIQNQSEILVICTGSEPYPIMRKHYEHEHTVWRDIVPYDVSFVKRTAMEQIATIPVMADGVTWLPESLERLWDMTEGHPWVTQILAERVTKQLNEERRRLVGPGDVDRAANIEAASRRISALWWNEKEDLVTPTHRQVAFLILQNQPDSRYGLPDSQLAEICQKSGIRSIGRYLEEMEDLEVLTQVREGDEPRWRIRGAFLERYLMTLMQDQMRDRGAKQQPDLPNQPLALMLDWENVKISLSKMLDMMSEARAQALRPHLSANSLGTRLLDAASRHGLPRQRYAVADWDRPFFQGDQKALKNARYWPDIAGDQKDNASDHVLVEKIHFVLREHPEISVFVIATGDGDFRQAIQTLQEKGKHVVLWATRNSINEVYKESLKGPDRIQIEWLEDLVFGEGTTG